MNILYISPSNGIGGAELSLSEIIEQASKRGHNVYAVLGYPKKGDTKLYDKIKKHCKGIFIIRQMRWHIPNKMTWYDRKINYLHHIFLSGWHILPVIKMIRLIKKYKIDIIHTNTVWGLDGLLAAKILNVPHIWHIRETIGNNNGSIVNFPFQNYPNFVCWFMDKLNSIVIANSKYTASFENMQEVLKNTHTSKIVITCSALTIVYRIIEAIGIFLIIIELRHPAEYDDLQAVCQ